MNSTKQELIRAIKSHPDGVKILQIRTSADGCREDCNYWSANHVLLVTEIGAFCFTSYHCNKDDDGGYSAFRIEQLETFDPEEYPFFVTASAGTVNAIKTFEPRTLDTPWEVMNLFYDNCLVWMSSSDMDGVELSLQGDPDDPEMQIGPTRLRYNEDGSYCYAWDFRSIRLQEPYQTEYKEYAWHENSNNKGRELVMQTITEEPFEFLGDSMRGKRLTDRCYLMLREGTPIAIVDTGTMIVWLNIEEPEINDGYILRDSYDHELYNTLADLYGFLRYAIVPMLNEKLKENYSHVDEDDEDYYDYVDWRGWIEDSQLPEYINWNEIADAFADVVAYRVTKRVALEEALQNNTNDTMMLDLAKRYRRAENYWEEKEKEAALKENPLY